MFARRHPILFFISVISGCLTVCFLGFLGLILLGVTTSGLSDMDRSSRGNIGILEVEGPILSSKTIIDQLKAFTEDDEIKAIILRVESPGGGIGPSQEIYRELMKTREKKQVIASMGSVAASGGYYIAAAAQGIVANPGTITGSIGVIMEYANLMAIAEKIGISPVVFKSGEYKDMGSPLRELKEGEKKIFQDLVDELHLQFVSDAARARNMDPKDMATLADGRVYTGQTALKLKLVDRLGNLDDAIQWAGERAGIKGELLPVYPKEDRMTFFRKLADTMAREFNLSGAIPDQIKFMAPPR